MKTPRTFALVVAFALIALAAVACGGGNSTPTKAYQTFYKAAKSKDVAAFKSILPKKVLEEGEKEAKQANKSLDDMIKVLLDSGLGKVPEQMPESRNEVIAGDGKTATLEVKNPERDAWKTLHFVKEDDGWKIDFNQMG